MRRLRTPARRIDTLRTENRPKRRGRFGRVIYLSILALFLLALFDLLAGDLVYLRGEGMISRDVAILSPEFDGVVLSAPMEPGDDVESGDPLVFLRSKEMLQDIAALTSNLAAAEAQLSEMRIRKLRLDSLIPLARESVSAAVDRRDQLGQLRDTGLVTVKDKASAVEDAFTAHAKLEGLREEARIVDADVAALQRSVARARGALGAVEDLYAQGIMIAPVDGIIGTITVSPGEGVVEGQGILEIFHGPSYVLAYVPLGALYDVEPQDEVVLRYGFKTVRGRIEARLPLAYRLPQEFQRVFQTIERQQLVRIALIDEEAPPPLFTEVEVTWPWSLRVAFAEFADDASETVGSAIDSVVGFFH